MSNSFQIMQIFQHIILKCEITRRVPSLYVIEFNRSINNYDIVSQSSLGHQLKKLNISNNLSQALPSPL